MALTGLLCAHGEPTCPIQGHLSLCTLLDSQWPCHLTFHVGRTLLNGPGIFLVCIRRSNKKVPCTGISSHLAVRKFLRDCRFPGCQTRKETREGIWRLSMALPCLLLFVLSLPAQRRHLFLPMGGHVPVPSPLPPGSCICSFFLEP